MSALPPIATEIADIPMQARVQFGTQRIDERMPTDEDAEIFRLMREAVEKSRGYASIDKRQAELHAARVLSRFLFAGKDYSVSGVINDPPDALVQLGEHRYGVEITEIVDRKAVERAAKRKWQGLPIEYDWADWNVDRLSKSLSDGISAKDHKLSKASRDYDELLLAFVTDETMIYPELVASVVGSVCVPAQHIDRAFVILSYHPAVDLSVFPDRCQIFEIALKH